MENFHSIDTSPGDSRNKSVFWAGEGDQWLFTPKGECTPLCDEIKNHGSWVFTRVSLASLHSVANYNFLAVFAKMRCQGHTFRFTLTFYSIIFNIPRFFELRTEFNFVNQTIYNESLGENVTEEVKHPVVSPTEFRENLEYSRDYVLIANSVALGFIPILTLIVLNSCIFRTISKATQRHNAISSNQRRDHSVRKKSNLNESLIPI